MSAISHLVRHDVRALRLPLMAWLLVLLAQAAVMAFGPEVIDPGAPRAATQSVGGFLAGARLAFTVLLTVLLVHRDSPVGTTAFWLTRPIPPMAMAASKLISSALLLVALPAVIGWLLFTALGLRQGDVLDGMWELVLEQAMVVGLSAMGAAITATIPQFAVAAVAAIVLIVAVVDQARSFIDQMPTPPLAGWATPFGSWVAVTVLGAAGVIAYQYSRRRVVSAAAAVTGVLLLGALCALIARTPLDAARVEPLRAGVLDPAAVTLDVDPSAARAESGLPVDVHSDGTRQFHTGAIVRTSGTPPAIILQPWSIASTWHPGNAPPIRWQRQAGAAYRRSVQRDRDDDGQPLASIALGLGGVELLKPVRAAPTAF